MNLPSASNALDWMNLSPADWLHRYLPGWQTRTYADLLRMPVSNLLGTLYPQLGNAPQFMPGTFGPVQRGPVPWHGPHCQCRMCLGRVCRGCGQNPCQCHGCAERVCRGCGQNPCRCHEVLGRTCHGCGHDPCQCVCCVGDVDWVVYARVGERRVIPVLVENSRHRQKDIKVELSAWRTRGGKAAPVETVSTDPTTFTLAPCSQREIALVVQVGASDPAGREGSQGDVDDCLVAVADLNLVGCDHRPLRLAVAILPRDCAPFRTSCGCACC